MRIHLVISPESLAPAKHFGWPIFVAERRRSLEYSANQERKPRAHAFECSQLSLMIFKSSILNLQDTESSQPMLRDLSTFGTERLQI